MLIRVRGGETGIKEYLEEGRKDGRDYRRAELDERVILAGDLALTDAVISGMDKQGERYLHITLSFKEDEISRELLQAITDEFRDFAMTAFDGDEYNFYAEAHLPRIRSYTNQQTGEFIERKPHIHIVIPEYNLLSQRNLNPLGKVDQQTQFLEAFQEHINAKFGLASPKDNRRIAWTDESTIIARYKGDYFKGASHDLKARILSDVLDQGVTDLDQFRALVERYGDTRTRNAGRAAEYLNVKPEGAAKGTNLKDYVFSREFIELPADEKRRCLAGELRQQYEDVQPARPTPTDIAARLQEWRDVRAVEVKYLNSGNRKAYTAYRKAEPMQRRAMLAELATRFYARHRHERDMPDVDVSAEPTRTTSVREAAALPSPVAERDGRPADSVVGQHIAEQHEHATRGTSARQDEFRTIKRELDAARLLAAISRSHGVIPEKYEITKGADGSDRIRCGRRNLNVTDFLTQELHLPWREAAPMLRTVYAEQTGHQPAQAARGRPRGDLWSDYRREWPAAQRERRERDWQVQKKREQDRRAELRRQYQAERRAVQNDRTKTPAERRAALSVARMGKVTRDMELRELIDQERAELKAHYRLRPAEQYRAYLAERAERGDTEALAELRRQRAAAPAPTGRRIEHRTPGQEGAAATLPKPASYRVDRDGNVTYYDAQQRAMFTDRGPAVEFAAAGSERATLEAGLRLALAKFGPEIRLRGTDAYKAAMVEIAADSGLRVQFSDAALQARYEQRREETRAGRAYLDKAASRTGEKQPQQNRTRSQARTSPDTSRDQDQGGHER
jgi:hypothetical protein